MGFASYGLPSFSISDYFRGSIRTRTHYADGSKQPRATRISRASASGVKHSFSEDEVRLRPDDDQVTSHIRAGAEASGASVKSNDALGGIDIRRDFDWSVDEIHNVGEDRRVR